MAERYESYDCDEVWDNEINDTLSVESIIYSLNVLAAIQVEYIQLRNETIGECIKTVVRVEKKHGNPLCSAKGYYSPALRALKSTPTDSSEGGG